jgi:hypothetical protein
MSFVIKTRLESLVQLILGVYRLDRLHLRGLNCQGLVVTGLFDTML